MLKIKIFGTIPPCAKCMRTEEVARKVAEKFKGRVEVEKWDALSDEGQKHGVMMTPTVLLDDKVVTISKIPKDRDLEKMINQKLEG